MTSLSTVGFDFLPLVVTLHWQVMSSNNRLGWAPFCICICYRADPRRNLDVRDYRGGTHSPSDFCPVKLLLCNLIIFGSPALVILQPLPSELFGPAYRGGVSCVYIIGAAITQDTPMGGRLKKSSHKQAFYYSIINSLPPSSSFYNWTFFMAWLLSTTVTFCRPPFP